MFVVGGVVASRWYAAGVVPVAYVWKWVGVCACWCVVVGGMCFVECWMVVVGVVNGVGLDVGGGVVVESIVVGGN
jgi:hypothetical protein